MLTLASRSDQAKVIAAIRAGNDGNPYKVGLELFADTQPIMSRVLSAQWGQTDMPITMTATVAGYMPRRLDDARMKLIAEVAGVPIHQLHGKKTAFLPSADAYATDLITSSAGSLSAGPDAIKLGEFTEYPGTPPHLVVRDIVQRLPYDQSLIDIQVIPKVIVNYVGSGLPSAFEQGFDLGSGEDLHSGSANPAFLAHEATGDVLSRLAATQTIGYIYKDTAYGGMTARVPGAVAAGTMSSDLSVLYRHYSPLRLPAWDLQRPHPPTERYSHVRVFHQGTDGKPLYEVVEEIPYPADVRKPHRRRNLDIPFDDTSDAGPDNARRRAVREALLKARGTQTGDELTLPVFDPLIEHNDPFWVAETHRDDDGLWEISWAMRVGSYKHLFGEGTGAQGASGTLDTAVSYTATILEEDKIQVPTIILGGHSTGVVQTPDNIEPLGNDASGFWHDPTQTTVYLGADSDGTWIDDTLDPGNVGNDSDGFWIDEEGD